MKNRICKYILCACFGLAMMVAGEEITWGGNSYYQAKITSESTGSGSAYVSASSGTFTTTGAASEPNTTPGEKVTFYLRAVPNTGYHFSSWNVVKDGNGNVKEIASTTSSSTTTIVYAANGSDSGEYDGKSEEGDDKYYWYNYKATATFEENFYAKLTLNSSGITVTPTGGGTGNVEKTSDKVQFNISTSKESSGYHFVNWTGTGVSFSSSTSESTTASVSPATTGGSGNAANYTATANYVQNRYYASVTLAIYSEKADGSGSASIANNTAKIVEGSPYTSYTTTSGGNITCNLQYLTAENGWHFAQWNKGNSPGSCSFGKNTDKNTTFTFQAPSNYDDDNASPYSSINNYTIQCKFVENYYTTVTTAVICGEENKGGKAYVTLGTSIGEGVTTTTANDGYGQTYARDVDYAVRAVADAGYHFVGWTIDNTSESTIVSPSSLTSQLKVKAVNSKQGSSNKNNFVITAHFEEDKFNAKLTTAVSSASDASSSTAQVSTDSTSWSGSATLSASTANSDVTFYVKATPVVGYKCIGWSVTNGSTELIPGLGATGRYIVKSSSVQGATNAKDIYAVFKKEYSIVIKAVNSVVGTDRIVFNVTGPQNYRVSVPVGSSLVLKDVEFGTYTITPEKNWNWNYDISPDSQTVNSFDSENKCIKEFTVNAKSGTKKHSEVKNTIEY